MCGAGGLRSLSLLAMLAAFETSHATLMGSMDELRILLADF
jgi:hypothetical protein